MTELLIQGDWVPAAGAAVHELIDPATRKLLGPIRSASQEQRQRALAAARGALEGWSRRGAAARTAIVRGSVAELREAAGGLAERQAIESGQPLRECQDLVALSLRRLRNPPLHEEPTDVLTRRLPPQALWPFWESTLQAIAAGSTMVCELPADHAMTALAVARSAHGVPPGVLNVVTVEAVPRPPTDVATDFVFVGQDTQLELAVPGSAALRLYNTGQRAGQSARIHVAAPLAYAFADRMHEYLAFLEAGDPRKPLTDLGPLHSEQAMLLATQQIAATVKQGALVKLGGRPYQPWGLRGFFLQPTLLIEGTGHERAPLESIAGPVVIISPTTDIGAALRDSVGASDSTVRLSAFTQQREKLERSLQVAALSGQTVIDWIDAPRPEWFPYRNRRGMKL